MSSSLPPIEHLEHAIRRWAKRGELRTLIGAVDAWSQVEDLSPTAQLAQARALLHLVQMDRAWSLLEPLARIEKTRLDASLLLAKLFIARGWSRHAREWVDAVLHLDPKHREAATLQHRLSNLTVEPPLLPDPPYDGTHPQVLLVAAESLLAAGSPARARTVLHHLQQTSPHPDRVDDLLWALDGAPPMDFEELLSLLELMPPPKSEPEAFEAEEEQPSEDYASFPALFQAHVGQVSDEEATETTLAAAMASPLQMQNPPTAQTEGQGDTDILRIVRVERPTPRVSSLPPEPPKSDMASLATDLDLDDEDLIILNNPSNPLPRRASELDDLLLPEPTSEAALRAEEEQEATIRAQRALYEPSQETFHTVRVHGEQPTEAEPAIPGWMWAVGIAGFLFGTLVLVAITFLALFTG